MRLLWFKGHGRWRELAGAYADGELPPGERARYEAHLASCDECAGAVVDQRALKQMFAAGLPAVTLPRSFAISEAMLAERGMAVVPVRHPRFAMRAAQATAAVAVLVFAGLIAYDLAPGGGSNQASRESAPVADTTSFSSGAEAPAPPAKGVTDSLAPQPTPATLPTYAPGGGATGQGLTPPRTGVTSNSYAPVADTPAAGDDALRDTSPPPLEPSPTALRRESENDVDALRVAEAALGALAAGALATYFILRTRRRI